jgi:hypothetical protein
MFDHNTTGVQESGDFTPIPAGTYTFRIGDKEVQKSQGGYHQVIVWLIVNEGEHEGRRVRHMVTFLPQDNPGAGIAKRWLHAIGEEYEGKITVNPAVWSGVIKCDVKIEQFTKKDGTPGKSNKVTAVHLPANFKNENPGFRPLPKIAQKVIAAGASSMLENEKDLDDVPF